MHACVHVRQPRELTYVIGHEKARSHLWKFTDWRFVCRGLTVTVQSHKQNDYLYVLVYSSCHNKIQIYHNKRNLFSHNSGGWKSKVRVPEWSGSGEGPPPASWFTYGHLLAVSLRGGERGIGLLMDWFLAALSFRMNLQAPNPQIFSFDHRKLPNFLSSYTIQKFPLLLKLVWVVFTLLKFLKNPD